MISLKYRPQTFDDLTGQKHIILSLKGALRTGRIGHAFLFAGPRGVGKTTTARILAKSLNCVEGPTVEPCQQCQSCKEITLSRSIDVVEIDGASNRGIEEIRNLREGVKYSPLQGRYKVYIIDEVHMLTQEAFNALLKTLEEPPPKVVFVFATTNPTKIPGTILSRCQRFVFKRLTAKEIVSRLRKIADAEAIHISNKALFYLAARADGSIRDGESILEQLTSFVEGEITEQDIFNLVGFLDSSFYFALIQQVAEKNLGEVFATLNNGIENGADPMEVYRGLTAYLRAALLLHAQVPIDMIELDEDEITVLKKMPFDEPRIVSMLETCLEYEEMIKRSVNARVALELLLSQLILPGDEHRVYKDKPKSNPGTHNTVREAGGIKEELFRRLQKNGPKLAGIIHRADIRQEGNAVLITVDNEFSQKQLQRSIGRFRTTLKDITGQDVTVTVRLVEQNQKDDKFIETMKGLFDAEEIR
ncbi:MAG: DNA polymerase III subunit gamma/tau [candidate division WOR-3 bacterium]|nr:MAG: DNA polymerase III subunit gamma/tau [candidate division WOR-3 bacterium]